MRLLNRLLRSFIRKYGKLFKITNAHSIYIYSVIIGILSGLLAILFSTLLNSFEALFLRGANHHDPPPGEVPPLALGGNIIKAIDNFIAIDTIFAILSSPWFLFCLPVMGGLLVGLIIRFLYKDTSGSGTDEMIRSFHYREGNIPGRGAFFKAIGTTLTISTGGSGGKEGPTAYIGAALGSFFGKILKVGPRARRTLLLAGTAGGLGAIFRAPLGGAMTAVEVLYREDIESDSLVPCLISSVTAYLVFSGVIGRGSLFEVADVGLRGYHELIIYVILGLVCYVIGFVYVRMMQIGRMIMNQIKLPIVFKPAFGGLFIGAFMITIPEVTGSGMGYLHETINGRSTAYTDNSWSSSHLHLGAFFFFLAFLKIITTSITAGSKGSGGLFAPSLFIGAMLGGGVANFSQYLLPTWDISTASFMLVGMGAFFSGVARTPFSAMIMISDIIGSYALLPPLMIVSMIAFTLSSRWSLYKQQVYNRFKSPAHFWDMELDILGKLKIGQEFSKLRYKAIIPAKSSISAIKRYSLKIETSDFIVTDKDKIYQGMFSLKSLAKKYAKDSKLSKTKVSELCHEGIATVTKEDSLSLALQKISKGEFDKVAILDSKKKKVLGYVLSQDILDSYKKHIS